MGEIAEDMINGNVCQECNMWLGEGDGFPRTCVECGGDAEWDVSEDDELVD